MTLIILSILLTEATPYWILSIQWLHSLDIKNIYSMKASTPHCELTAGNSCGWGHWIQWGQLTHDCEFTFTDPLLIVNSLQGIHEGGVIEFNEVNSLMIVNFHRFTHHYEFTFTEFTAFNELTRIVCVLSWSHSLHVCAWEREREFALYRMMSFHNGVIHDDWIHPTEWLNSLYIRWKFAVHNYWILSTQWNHLHGTTSQCVYVRACARAYVCMCMCVCVYACVCVCVCVFHCTQRPHSHGTTSQQTYSLLNSLYTTTIDDFWSFFLCALQWRGGQFRISWRC